MLKSSTIPDLTLKRQYYNCYKFTEKEFLNKPVITLTPWDSVKKGAVVTVKCAVEGMYIYFSQYHDMTPKVQIFGTKEVITMS